MDLTALLLSRIQFGSPSRSTSSSRPSRSGWRRGSPCSRRCICGPAARPTGWSSSSGSRSSVSHSGSASSPASSWRSSSARIGACCARMSGPIQGPLLSYETFTAFFLEASFFGILLFGRSRVPPWFYLFSTAMVALGTTLSAFWIMANNSWMQVPVGYVMENGAFAPDDWSKILSARCCGCASRTCCLRRISPARFASPRPGHGTCCAGILPPRRASCSAWACISPPCWLPVQLLFGHLNGEYVVHHQPAKMAAIEARWHDEKPASEVLLAWPDVENRRNLFAITLPPPFGSLIDSDSLTAGEVGLDSIPPRELATGARSRSSASASWSAAG